MTPLTEAYDYLLRLREAARKIRNLSLRRSFLENVPYHQQLRQLVPASS